MPVGELRDPGRPQRLERPGRGRRRARCSGSRPTRSAPRPAAFAGVEHRLETGRDHRRRPLRQRLAGDPAGRGHRRAPGVRPADRADRRRPRQGHRPRPRSAPVVAERAVAAVLIGESGPDLERRVPGRRPRPDGAGRRPRGGGPARRRHRPRGAAPHGRRDAGRSGRPCCSARPPPASTCSWTTRPAAGRSRPPSRRWPPSDRGGEPMNLAPPIPRLERLRRAGDPGRPAERRPTIAAPPIGRRSRAGRRRPARAPPGRLHDPRRRRRPDRDRHPDGLLVVGAEGLPVAGRRHVRDRRPADPVGGPRARRDGGDDAGRLPLPAAGLGAVLHRRRRRCWCWSSSRSSTSSSAARRAGSSSGRCPAIHPAEIAKLALVIYLAHWFAKRGTRVHGFWAGTVPFLIIVAPIIALVFKEPDLGTTMVITPDRVHDVLRRRRRTWSTSP